MIFDCVDYFVTADFVTVDLNCVMCNPGNIEILA